MKSLVVAALVMAVVLAMGCATDAEMEGETWTYAVPVASTNAPAQ